MRYVRLREVVPNLNGIIGMMSASVERTNRGKALTRWEIKWGRGDC
jgi:hypothetical protein